MKIRLTNRGLLIKMEDEFDHLHCRECDVALFLEEVFEAKDKCPVCGKKTSWISDPIFIKPDGEE